MVRFLLRKAHNIRVVFRVDELLDAKIAMLLKAEPTNNTIKEKWLLLWKFKSSKQLVFIIPYTLKTCKRFENIARVDALYFIFDVSDKLPYYTSNPRIQIRAG